MKTPSKKQQARFARAIGAHVESHGQSNEQTRGPVWRGPLPRRASRAITYSAAHAKANREIDERGYGLGLTPGSGLAQTLARLTRGDRRALLAIVQRKAGTRRDREQRALMRRLAARGVTI